jgi:hypothetical protein
MAMTVLLAALARGAHTETALEEGSKLDMVRLVGRPEKIGAIWGRLNAVIIQRDIRKNCLDIAAEKRLSEDTLIERSARFVEICEELAPHWLAEARAIAAEAEIDADLYVSYIANVYRALFLGDECTSYSVSREYTKDHAIFFHKNRDNVEKPQAVCIVSSDVPDVNKFITVTDASVLACMMMVNDKGLAGSADTGGLPPGEPKFRGLMNTFVLRHIAERAASCAEALAIIEEFVAKGHYAGGGGTGTHWLFVDKAGQILEVSNNAVDVTHACHDEKVYFSARGDTDAANTLKNATDPIDFCTFHDVSRDPSMCFDSSISGLTVDIHPDQPGYLTCAWATLPAKGLAFPLFMGGDATPKPLVDGEAYALLKDRDGANGAWESLEEAAYANGRLVQETGARLLAEGKSVEAKEILETWTEQTAKAQIEMLRLCDSAASGAR